MAAVGRPDGGGRADAPARALHALIPTYGRPHGLRSAVLALEPLRAVLSTLFVVDNGQDPHVQELCAELERRSGLPLVYLSAPNIGPAGATALAMRQILDAEEASACSWLLRLDDDRPLDVEQFLQLWQFVQSVEGDPQVAAVGLLGATWSPLAARLRRPRRRPGQPTEVDYLKTGEVALFRLSAAREVGVFRADLFFGMTEVEYGLRLRRHGFRLLEASQLWRAAPVTAVGRPRLLSLPDWRRYYSLRNLIVILREHGHGVVAARVALSRGLLKPGVAVLLFRPHARRQLALSLRAVRDAYRGRLGRTVDPASWDVTPTIDTRGDRVHT